jgi:hypothetical protein
MCVPILLAADLQPLDFEELARKCVAVGIDDRGYRLRLKEFLDSMVRVRCTGRDSR